MKKTNNNYIFLCMLGLFIALLPFNLMNCSGSSSNSKSKKDPVTEQPNTPAGDNKISVGVSDHVKDIQLTAGEKTEVSFVYNLSPSAGPYDSITVNLQETLNSGAVNIAGIDTRSIIKTLLKSSAVGEEGATAQMSVRVGSSDQIERVCQFGYLYGPFTIKGNESNEPESIDPPTVTAEPATVGIINAGSAAICIEIESPVDATINVDNIEVGRTGCNEESADIIGTWAGTYTCENENTNWEDPTNLPITLTIIKDEDGYHYKNIDEEAYYDGYLCGNTFEFEGGGEGYTESGTFVLESENKATKTSSWVSNDGLSSGDCSDILEREE